MTGEDHTTDLEVKLVSLQEQVKQLQRDLEDEKVPDSCIQYYNTVRTLISPYIHYSLCSTHSVTCNVYSTLLCVSSLTMCFSLYIHTYSSYFLYHVCRLH